MRFGRGGAVRANGRERRVGAGLRNLHRGEIRGQRDRAGPSAARLEVLEEIGDAAAKEAGVRRGNATRFFEPLADFGLRQMKNKVVGPEAGDIDIRVEAFERV